MRISTAQAQALGAFISRIRDDWDHPGIVAAITKAAPLGNPAEIGTALCRLAANHELRTPALLSEPGPHWHDTSVATRVWPVMCQQHPDVRASRCDIDGPCAAHVTTRGADDVKAALRSAPRMTLPVQRPEPKPRDLDDVRARADREVDA